MAYWYALVPAHLFIFRGLTAAIARRAETAYPIEGEACPEKLVRNRDKKPTKPAGT